MKKITISDILKKKHTQKITMLTCYDYSFAKALDETGVDIILVGDSLANVVLGLKETRTVGFSEMLNHTRAVAKAVRYPLLVADMPYLAYQKNSSKAVVYAQKFIKAGADAVKIEWFKDCEKIVKKLINSHIPVMGHIGLTPQTSHLLGGFKVQGRELASARNLLSQARLLEKLGVFGIVLECIPSQVAAFITNQLEIPTLGIGAGKYCSGQVLVLYDLLGLYHDRVPKFVRHYKDLYSQIQDGVKMFIHDVRKQKFPAKNESFFMEKEQLKLLRGEK